jgi:hypothetical protein
MKMKCLAIGIILLFVGTFIIPETIGMRENVKNKGYSNEIGNEEIITMENNKIFQRNMFTTFNRVSCFSYIFTNINHPIGEMNQGIFPYFEKIKKTNFSSLDMDYKARVKSVETGEHFYGYRNNSIFIVKVTSPNTIYLEDIFCQAYQGIIGEQTSALESVTAIFFTNMTLAGVLASGTCLHSFEGSLRYEQLKLGRFLNYVNDNRTLYTVNNQGVYIDRMASGPITLPSGAWYFIFTSNIFDLKQEDQWTNLSVWMNFTEECSDIDISTSEGGTIYGLWYGEYNANVVRSKGLTSEFIMNGKTHFHINDTFIYQFVVFPWNIGYWNLRWNTPQGRMTYIEIRTQNGTHYKKNNVEACWHGIDDPGDYTLRIGSFDYDSDPAFYAMMPYFLGLDVKLF